ncbi:2-oxo-4-hydroxy-4-carboxy-5-ureidoimidazoline decarboxylase [Paractinoplanes brasiliensis]|uniref:2-oxo-4-hydroxy-4-carboxy-5-ureidoimidazoline decarboxylase n=1 Tax=Paractinoplanes brasiliensis TaxID=52695 RepID=A0A4V3C8G2_9ACTN|nr:2-oxo-4-hydroxy-4-carboxy-5-ureidoimidazoline decarboxylase [Actinoplanes brasiliensis]TDO41468.1 2-oxo-4-hydroxy-4-carboxy-5-ureidoimidazoline decarboxylase [Actinoplanes brasiliensis]GID27247.1 2-oxo-4-hydroxy-4-carboxy-5-ureidoimidazoline decarboxylase [Actinoplanes brasiliensis]
MDAVEVFNSLPAARLEEDLLACLAAPAWGSAVIAGRPYARRDDILAAADAAARALSLDDVLTGLSAHPRIGERAGGDTREAAWSRREQSAAAQSADEVTKAALIEANRAYEGKFGHVFLIFASGRTQEDILAAARERLTNDPAAEREIVADELRKIGRLRLERVLDAL